MSKSSAFSVLFILVPLVGGALCGRFRYSAIGTSNLNLIWLISAIVGLPLCILLVAKVFNSNTLGWIFGLSLIIGLPLLILFGIGFAAGSAFRHHNQTAQTINVEESPKSSGDFSCSHLQPLERAMRSAGLEIIPANRIHLRANCCIQLEELTRQFGVATAALYEERHFIDRSHLDPKSAFFWCDACHSRIEVIHADEASAVTPWFPSPREIQQRDHTPCAECSW